jgi:hypothetical protein
MLLSYLSCSIRARRTVGTGQFRRGKIMRAKVPTQRQLVQMLMALESITAAPSTMTRHQIEVLRWLLEKEIKRRRQYDMAAHRSRLAAEASKLRGQSPKN